MVTVPHEPPMPGSRSPQSPGAVTALVVATVGLGFNLRAWILLGPQLHERFDVGLEAYVLLMGLPLLVAALVRLPVGVLTDRYGVRVMFPAVSLIAAASAFGMGLADSLPAVAGAGAVAGVAGAALVVGGSYVSTTFPYGRRGLALGVFSSGTALAVAFSAIARAWDPEGRRAALVLGGTLVCFAGLAALVFRDHLAVHRAGSPVRRCIELIRLASTTSLSLLYTVSLGGLMAITVYLPIYLTTVFRLAWFPALVITGAVAMLAAVARLLGGWWTDRRPTARLLTVCYAGAAGLCLVVAMAPRLWWLTAPLIAATAVCDGAASGVLLALIGKAARADSAGAVLGLTGAAAALGALVPPLLLAGAERLSHSYSTAWILLALALLAVAFYVRDHGLRIGLGLAVRYEPEPSATATTIAIVDESDIRLDAPALVARLAELAVSDELVVVHGSDRPARTRRGADVLVTGLRDRLPRHSVVVVRAAPWPGALGRLATVVGDLVEDGTVAIATTQTAEARGVAAHLASCLQADRVLVVSYTLAEGAELHEVWNRRPAARSGG